MSAGTIWDFPGLPLPALPGDQEADVCVIGLGASGLSCIRQLQKRRVGRIVAVDAVGVGGGAAGRNGGFLLAGPAPFHHVARQRWGAGPARDLYALTLVAMDRIERQHRQTVRRIGSVRLAADDAERQDIAEHLQALRDDDFRGEPWTGADGDGLFLPDDGVFQPKERNEALAEAAWDAGAWLYGETRVLGIEPGRVVTERGVLKVGAVVVCVDGRLDRLLPELAHRVRNVRLQMLATGPVAPRWGHAMYHNHGYDYWQQLPDGRIALGGKRDVAGDAALDVVDASPTDLVQDALTGFLRERLQVQAPITHRWAGIVGYTPDHLPIVEQVRPDVFAAGGYCGTGNVIGALAGEALADAVAGAPEHELVRIVRAARAAT